jgi:hypothetical protein
MTYLISILTSAGVSIITCVAMETYHQRRATDEIGDYDKGME